MINPVPASNLFNNSGLEQVRGTALMLDELLKKLYREPTSPDIITLDDIKRRYPLTGLGAPAINAIAQARRIIHGIGDHNKIGLCEFHVGLIYLYWGDCRGAVKQFEEARYQWKFDHQQPSVCLAHFAVGIAQHNSYEFEPAMRNYGKAERLVPRLQYSPSSKYLNEFLKVFPDALHAAQQASRQEMWGMPAQQTQEEPDRNSLNDDCKWFQVDKKIDQIFLPYVDEGIWLLVNTQIIGYDFSQDELVVVGKSLETDGGITLSPPVINRPFQRIYLARTQFQGEFTRDQDGKVALSSVLEQIPILRDEVVGIVVGFWEPLVHV